jgi:hypothetical protein
MKQQNVITDARNLYLRSPAFESQPNLHLYDYRFHFFFLALPADAGRVSNKKSTESTPFLIHHLLLLYHSAQNNPYIWLSSLHNHALINLRVLSFLWAGRIELRACARHKAATVFRIQWPSYLTSQWQELIWIPFGGEDSSSCQRPHLDVDRNIAGGNKRRVAFILEKVWDLINISYQLYSESVRIKVQCPQQHVGLCVSCNAVQTGCRYNSASYPVDAEGLCPWGALNWLLNLNLVTK